MRPPSDSLADQLHSKICSKFDKPRLDYKPGELPSLSALTIEHIYKLPEDLRITIYKNHIKQAYLTKEVQVARERDQIVYGLREMISEGDDEMGADQVDQLLADVF